MTEAQLTQKHLDACRALMPGCEALKHSDRFNGGYPDATVTWRRRTTWWETKFYDDKTFKSPPVQKLQCARLAVQGVCYYIIYVRIGDEKQTRIVHPALLAHWDTHSEIEVATGFNHTWVANFIRNKHLEIHS